MQLYLKNTHAEHSKQRELLAQIKADMGPYADIKVKEKVCKVNSYFLVSVPRSPDYLWMDDYLTRYLILLSRNIDKRRNKSECFIDLRK